MLTTIALTNSSIINAFVNYVYGEGLIDKASTAERYVPTLKDCNARNTFMVQDYKTTGLFSTSDLNSGKSSRQKLLKLSMPVYKLGVNYDGKTKSTGIGILMIERARYRPSYTQIYG
jgi:hypothetical protein